MGKVRNPGKFVDEFLKEYLDRGFGTLAKRDFEILVFHLLIKHGYFDAPLNYFEASRRLGMSERRVKNFHQDVQLRYAQYTEQEARERFVRLFESQRVEVSGDRYRFQVTDPFLNQVFREWVAGVGGFTDSSFNADIVSLPKHVFLKVLEKLTTAQRLNEIKDALPDVIIDEVRNKPTKKGLIRAFTEKYLDTLAEKSAEATVAAATTGISLGLRALLGLPPA